ncbi:MAG TPA: tetratricopeptide repeat protein [Kofleriaceae bacterium]|nr:tetratricopeptide repeat protein [Kofleriaceae bacterium]
MSPDPVERDLLSAIVSNPDAIEPRVIYGDWLQARNDARGELMAVQLGLRERPGDAELLAREHELVEELTKALLANTTVPRETITRWHLGFVDALYLPIRTIRVLRTTGRAWFAQPVFAAVRELHVPSRFARNLRFIRQFGLGVTVRKLRFGEPYSTVETPTLSAIVRHLAHLTALELATTDVPDLTMLRALSLRDLALELTTITNAGIARLADAPWPLDAFSMRTHQLLDGDVFLNRLLDGSVLPSVRHLALGQYIPAMALLETLATSGRSATLSSITCDLSGAGDELQAAERHRAAFAHVQFRPLRTGNPYGDGEQCLATAAFFHYRLARIADAVPVYEEALRMRPGDSNARLQLAAALRKLQRLPESLATYDELFARTKRPTAAMYNARHYTLCELGRRSEARADLERAVEVDPRYADAWNNLGVERQRIGDSAGALEAYHRCREANAQHGHVTRNLATLYLEIGASAAALPLFRELLPGAPDDPWLHRQIAMCQLESGDASGARATLDARFENPAHPRDTAMYILRALALRGVGQVAAANADLDVAARETDCPGWYALVVFARGVDVWRRAVPDAAVGPRELADAVIAHGTATRPADARAMHAADVDDQLDASELAIAAALLVGDRALARARTHAAAAAYAAQPAGFAPAWWQTGATVLALARSGLDDEAGAFLGLVTRCLHGRRPIAELLAL